jgi:hypothetical protein
MFPLYLSFKPAVILWFVPEFLVNGKAFAGLDLSGIKNLTKYHVT